MQWIAVHCSAVQCWEVLATVLNCLQAWHTALQGSKETVEIPRAGILCFVIPNVQMNTEVMNNPLVPANHASFVPQSSNSSMTGPWSFRLKQQHLGPHLILTGGENVNETNKFSYQLWKNFFGRKKGHSRQTRGSQRWLLIPTVTLPSQETLLRNKTLKKQKGLI